MADAVKCLTFSHNSLSKFHFFRTFALHTNITTMRRIFLTAALAIILTNIAFAQTVSIADGRTIANNIITERFQQLGQNPSDYKIINSYTEIFEGNEVFHVYNLAPTGFVIVSADRSVEPLLAFSHESSCNATDRHSSVDAVLKSYASQISYAIKNSSPANAHTTTEWEHYSASEFQPRDVPTVEPLLSTKWNQGKYFNSQCPEDANGEDGHVVVGCVATAIAQVFNYFRYPSQGTGSYGYNHPTYGHLEMDFAQQHYDYDYMPTKPTDYNDNLARLLYSIGVSVDMNYGPRGSGMNNHKGAYTMRNYFGYNDEARYIFKDSLPTVIPDNIENDTVIPDSIWNGILVNHLNRRIPLYYAGWGDYVYNSGHAFVFDGYSDSTHYHINWGWGGSNDGFFIISNLSPSGSNFRLAHEVIVNATPKYENQGCEGLKTMIFYEGTLDDGSGPLNEYAPDSDCSWLISPQDSVEGYTLKFNKFDIDDSDNIIIYAGDSEDAPIVASIFGSDIPDETYTVNSTEMLVRFVSDATVSGYGWNMSYEPIRPTYCISTVTVTEMRDTISDGSNRWDYYDGTSCRWRIAPGNTSSFTFEFLELDTEYDKDFVKIYRNGRPYAKFSGDTIPEPIHFDGDNATIYFTSNNSVRAGGFRLAYSVVETGIDEYGNTAISIYPNPASSNLNIEGENITNISLYDITGKCVYEKILAPCYKYTVGTENFAEGAYFARIIDINGNCTTKKVIIER